MMLIPQPVGFGHTVETHKPPNYFTNSSRTPPIINGNLPNPGGIITSEAPQAVGTYSAGESGLPAGRMQSELPGLGMYPGQAGSSALGSPVSYGSAPGSVGTAPGLMAPHYGTTGIDPTSYYPSLGPTYDMATGGGEMWTGGYAQPPPGYYSYENTFGPQYPYDSRYCGMDINDGVRRKNATRESTNTLKAWLQEHKKNPYPTKGEKIMLAIITKMTLTQVSTWFANARRRLKKENKMTWVPKNRSNEAGSEKKDEDDDEEDDEIGSQTQDSDSKLDIGQSIDSDDSAVRSDVTSSNTNDVTNQYPRDLTSYLRNSSENTKLDAEGPVHNMQQGEAVPPPQQPLSNNSETPHPARYEGSEGSNPTIWSPANDPDQSGYRPPIAHQPYQQYQNNEFSSSSRAINHSMLSPCRIPPQSWSSGQYQNASTSMTNGVSSPCEADVRREPGPDGYSTGRFGNDAAFAGLPSNEQFGPPQGIYNHPKQPDMTSSLSPNSMRMTSSGSHEANKSPYAYPGYSNTEYYPDRSHMYYPHANVTQRYNPDILSQTGKVKTTSTPLGNSPISGVTPSKLHPAHSPYYASATMTVTSSQQDSSSFQTPYYPQQEELRNLPPAPYNIRSPNRDSPNVEINVSPQE